MNVKGQDPTEVVLALLSRSTCAVQVAACVVDSYGIFAWGINHVGPTGFGEHAEDHCIKRANRKRLSESVMYIAARRARNGKIVTARPCARCESIVRACGRTRYRDRDGVWKEL